MNISFLKKILTYEEFRLYEILKLKKNLESRFLSSNHNIGPNRFKFKFRSALVTHKISFLFKTDIQYLIKEIEKILNSRFNSFKNNGEIFLIESVAASDINVKPEFFNELEKYNELLQKHDANLIVQGSFADRTEVSYSDVDLVIMGNLCGEVIHIKKQIETHLLSIDPLQHHGVFFINNNSFTNYWQMDLPIETLKKSVVFSDKPVHININHYFRESLSSLNWVNNFINGYPVFPISLESGAFFSKYFLSQLMLVPALILAVKGQFVYKADSFSLAQKHYSINAWKCIEFASEIREKWNQDNINLKYIDCREDLNNKKVKEFNVLTDVVDIDKYYLNQFNDFYNIFIYETKNILANS
jgi:hypothetical protein